MNRLVVLIDWAKRLLDLSAQRRNHCLPDSRSDHRLPVSAIKYPCSITIIEQRYTLSGAWEKSVGAWVDAALLSLKW